MKVAVLLYGMLRNHKVCAPSFLRHVVEPNDASVIFFGPDYTDQPNIAFGGRLNMLGQFRNNPKALVTPTEAVSSDALCNVYGRRLVAYEMHSTPVSEFERIANEHVKREEWVLGLNPLRVFSMFFNVQGAARLLEAHEKRTGETFDAVVLTRPDLAFYSNILVPEKIAGRVLIPNGQGFSPWGERQFGNAMLYHYKNVLTGDYVPPKGLASFNDQLLVFERSRLQLFFNLFEDLKGYMAARVPEGPETILQIHLVQRAGLRCVRRRDWIYEIVRSDTPLVQNFFDTGEVAVMDPQHPNSRTLRRKHRVHYFFRDAKQFAKGLIGRLLR